MINTQILKKKKTDNKNTNFGQNYQIVKTQIWQSYQTQNNWRKKYMNKMVD